MVTQQNKKQINTKHKSPNCTKAENYYLVVVQHEIHTHTQIRWFSTVKDAKLILMCDDVTSFAVKLQVLTTP